MSTRKTQTSAVALWVMHAFDTCQSYGALMVSVALETENDGPAP